MSTITPTKMKPKIKARWLTALRSGRYLQGRGVLRKLTLEKGPAAGRPRYCYDALGVLCDLMRNPGKEWTEDCGGGFNTWAGSDTGLSLKACDWVGLSWENMNHVMSLGDFGTLTPPKVLAYKINPAAFSPYTHVQIADWIEQNA